MWDELSAKLISGDKKALARTISLVENESPGYEQFLENIPHTSKARVTGITGPPGAGKSTLTDALIGEFIQAGKKVGILCIDPSSPFNLGALLGDRIRMSEWYNNENVFIRSLASRGSMGGLNPKIIEITDIMRMGGFDEIIIETVGVGQSEIEIAGLADITIVMVVPESGDEVQTMKAGLMEIADIFVVNKADRPGADEYIRNLRLMLAPAFSQDHTLPIIKTVAATKEGLTDLYSAMNSLHKTKNSDKKQWLQAEKLFQLIQAKRMKDVNKSELMKKIESSDSNLYKLAKDY